MSLLNAGDGEFVVVYEMRATPEADSSGEKDTVFAMRVSVEATEGTASV